MACLIVVNLLTSFSSSLIIFFFSSYLFGSVSSHERILRVFIVIVVHLNDNAGHASIRVGFFFLSSFINSNIIIKEIRENERESRQANRRNDDDDDCG